MKHPALVAALVVVAGFGAEAYAQDGMLVLKARRWQAEIDGTLQVDSDSIAGTEVDFQDTFGLDDEESFNELHLTIGFLGKVNLQYLTVTIEGSETVSQDIQFGDVVFTVGTTVDTKVEFDLYTAMWQFGATLPVLPGFLSVGLGAQAGLKYLDIAAESHDGFGNEEEGELQAPVPVVGVYARATVSRFATIDFQIHGIRIPDNWGLDGEATFFDATLALDLNIAFVFAGVGYRMLHLDVDFDDGDNEFNTDFDVEGLFFEVGVGF